MRGIFIIMLTMVCNSSVLSAQEQKNHNKWSVVDASTISDLPSIGLAGQSAIIHDGRLFVLGGSNFPDAMPWEGGQKKYFDQCWAFRLNATLQPIAGTAMPEYPYPIAYATAILHQDEWIIAGGETPEGRTAAVHVLDLTQLAHPRWTALPALPIPLSNAHAFIAGETLHIIGGETGSVTTATHFTLDLRRRSAGWRTLKALPYKVSHGVLLHDKQRQHFLLLGGRAKQHEKPSIFYRSALAFDPATSEWNETAPLPYPLAAGTGVALQDGTMLVFGGDNGTVFNQVEECLIKAAGSKDPQVIESSNKIRKGLQSNHPGFSRAVLSWDEKETIWKETERLPFATPVTTQAVCNEQYLLIPGGEIRAGVRTANFYFKKLKTP